MGLESISQKNKQALTFLCSHINFSRNKIPTVFTTMLGLRGRKINPEPAWFTPSYKILDLQMCNQVGRQLDQQRDRKVDGQTII